LTRISGSGEEGRGLTTRVCGPCSRSWAGNPPGLRAATQQHKTDMVRASIGDQLDTANGPFFMRVGPVGRDYQSPSRRGLHNRVPVYRAGGRGCMFICSPRLGSKISAFCADKGSSRIALSPGLGNLPSGKVPCRHRSVIPDGRTAFFFFCDRRSRQSSGRGGWGPGPRTISGGWPPGVPANLDPVRQIGPPRAQGGHPGGPETRQAGPLPGNNAAEGGRYPGGPGRPTGRRRDGVPARGGGPFTIPAFTAEVDEKGGGSGRKNGALADLLLPRVHPAMG